MRIPERYHGKTVLKDRRHQEALKALKAGQSLFLTGECGTGKTHLAVGLAYEWLADSFEFVEGSILLIKVRPLFLSAVELFLELRQTFESDESEKKVFDKYGDVPLLIIDDIGAEKITEWSRQVLYFLVDRRYREMKQTIITSNLSQDELAEKIDERIASRICEMGVVIDMGSTDHRVRV